jgi:hypothetical protein
LRFEVRNGPADVPWRFCQLPPLLGLVLAQRGDHNCNSIYTMLETVAF